MSWKSFDVFQSGLQLWIKVSGQEIRQMEAHLKTQSHQKEARRRAPCMTYLVFSAGRLAGRCKCKAIDFANALRYAQTRGVCPRTEKSDAVQR